MRKSVAEQIEAYAEPEPMSGCWIWLGYRRRDGYGSLTARGLRGLAHRMIYETLVGPISRGLGLDHKCRVHACVNPAHLEPVTQRENVMRGTSFMAARARKMQCDLGHPLIGENAYIGVNGRRTCRFCRDAYMASYLPQYYQRNKDKWRRAKA